MNSPDGRDPSPFAARTRAPFPSANSKPPGFASRSVPIAPSTPAPVSVPVSAAGPAAPVSSVRSKGPWLAILLLMGVVGAAWWFLGRSSAGPTGAPTAGAATDVVPAVSAGSTPSVASAHPRDAKADYEALAVRAGALVLAPAERAASAEAALHAAAGAYERAVGELGPLVVRRIEAEYSEKAGALLDVKLADHATAAARALQSALDRSGKAAQAGRWVEAVKARDEAIGVLPEARKEIAGQLSGVAKGAAARGEADLATYFYERVLRLEPASAEARAYLFAHKFKAGEVLSAPDGMVFAYVPPGEFTRGSRAAEPGRGSDESQARVRITEGFFLGTTEVTQRQWDRVFGDGAAARALKAARVSAGLIGPDLPMHNVRWDEARDFCFRLSERSGRPHRLPTEAEWEYACRAGTGTAFNVGGDGLSAREANIDDGSGDVRSGPVAVGTVGAANAWGLRDMHGNVWEWCADWSAPYPTGDAVDPRGPADEAMGGLDLALRVVRGGGWNAPAADARSANRWEYSPAVRTDYIGLRVVREPDLAAR